MNRIIKNGLKKKQIDREPIGLTVSYDMGWNKRSSGHRYDSLSGHAFVIGVYTRLIITCVVFSKKCATCSVRKRKHTTIELDKEIDMSERDDNLDENSTDATVKNIEFTTSPLLDTSTVVNDDDVSGIHIISPPAFKIPRNSSNTVINGLPESPVSKYLTHEATVVNGASMRSIQCNHVTNEIACKDPLGIEEVSVKNDNAIENVNVVNADTSITILNRNAKLCYPVASGDALAVTVVNGVKMVSSPEKCLTSSVEPTTVINGMVTPEKSHRKLEIPKSGSVYISDACDHECTLNFDGSSGAMESDGLLVIFNELQRKYKGKYFYDTVVTDDDTKLKKYMTHPRYLPRGWKNHGGNLPIGIREPKWFADPTHRAKCVAGAFFEMTKGPATEIRATKLDALRMKKYYSYFIKQNRTKDIEWIVDHALAPLDHMFGDHHLCSTSWCRAKLMEDANTTETHDKAIKKSERTKEGYYRCKIKDIALYNKMKFKYEKYISYQFLSQCRHEFDTQMNEGMNNSVAYYATKGSNYCGTSSLLTRLMTAAGV